MDSQTDISDSRENFTIEISHSLKNMLQTDISNSRVSFVTVISCRVFQIKPKLSHELCYNSGDGNKHWVLGPLC